MIGLQKATACAVIAVLVALVLTPVPSALAQNVDTPSTSPDGAVGVAIPDESGSVAFQAQSVLRFDEFPLGTTITDQYQNKGVIFTAGSPVFLNGDTSNPTAPVLSGTPQFEGPIEARIVNPATGDPSTTNAISVDVGFIDTPDSVRVVIRNSDGDTIAVKRAGEIGINRIEFEEPGIAEISVRTIAAEPSGFAIDNLRLGAITGGDAVSYVALGDSFASGEGAGDYYPSGGDCHRSDNAYAIELAENNNWDVDFQACSGGVIADVLNEQIAALSNTTQLVTISIGGNDVPFVPELRDCFLFACADAEMVRRNVVAVRDPLIGVLEQIKAEAPRATILLIGYPKIFGPVGNCQSFGENDIAQINEWWELYNHQTAAIAAQVGVHYVDVIDEFDGRHRCDGNSAVNQTSVANIRSNEVLHPNAAGHNLMRNEIQRFLNRIGGVGASNPTPGAARCDGRNATLLATAAGDDLRGHDGPDVIVGGPADERIDGHGAIDYICGRGGRDNIDVGTGIGIVFGGSGADRIRGSNEADRLNGGPGADEIFARGGDDTVIGAGGADELSGGDQDDLIRGGSGDDDISGGRGADRIDGGSGANDECNGAAGADTHLGGCEILENF